MLRRRFRIAAADLTQKEKDALAILKGDLAKVREIKAREMNL